MKKVLFALLVITVGTGAMVSCKKDKATDCTAAVKNLSDATTAYYGAMNPANCKTYKAALQDYINSSCFSSLSAEQKAPFQESLNDLNCDQP